MKGINVFFKFKKNKHHSLPKLNWQKNRERERDIYENMTFFIFFLGIFRFLKYFKNEKSLYFNQKSLSIYISNSFLIVSLFIFFWYCLKETLERNRLIFFSSKYIYIQKIIYPFMTHFKKKKNTEWEWEWEREKKKTYFLTLHCKLVVWV